MNEKEKIVEGEEKKEKQISEMTLEEFVRTCLHRAMGKVLDLFRISEISDRALNQVTRTVKGYFNDLIRFMVDELSRRGYK